MECLEKGQLEHHGRHFAIKSNPVEYFDHTMVRQCRVSGITAQKMAVTFDDVFVNKSISRWHMKESNYFNIQMRYVKLRETVTCE